jgi:hypothetical protein
MIASRFWIGLLSIALGAMTLVAYLQISMHDRLGVRLASEGLAADSKVVSWYMKNSAREAAAQLLRFAANESVARSLASANKSERTDDIDISTRRQLKSSLAKIAQELPKDEAFDAVFAVSQTGEVVASIGYEQATDQEFELGGYPVVADALHGYVRDDTLVLDRLYRVVARPVELEVGQLPTGAIIGARVVDDRFAAEVSERTGAAIAFYASGRRLASGVPSGFTHAALDQVVPDLPSLDKDADYHDKGRTSVHQLADGLSVVYSRLPGEAWQLGAGYAVARQAPSVVGLLGVLKQADSKDKDSVSTLVIAAIALLGAGIGLLLSFLEYNVPLNAFRKQIKALSTGGESHLTVQRLRGPYRQLALDLNLTLDRHPRAAGGEDGAIAIGFDQMFGEAGSIPPMSAFGTPPSVPAGSFAQPSPPASAEVAAAPQPARAPEFAPAAPGFGQGFAASPVGMPPRRASRSGAVPAVDPIHGGDAGFPMTAGAAAVALAPVATNGAPAPGVLGAAPAPVFAPTRVASQSQAQPEGYVAVAADGAEEQDPEWMQVYHDFVRLKQDCGEAVEGFTYERFTATLRKNRDTLMRQHGVQRVQFSAYVKQGRAALKAKPVRD